MGSKQKALLALVVLGLVATAVFVMALSSDSSLALYTTAEEDIMRHAFHRFKKDQNKNYFNEYEEYHRFQIFKQNFMEVRRLNQLGEESNGPVATFEINQFSDLSPEEFKRVYLTYKPRTTVEEKVELHSNLLGVRFHATIDWVAAGKVTAVKNQGQCGSPYAFSATGALEGIYMIKNNKDISFAEQQLVDCSTSYGNQGCCGGFMDTSFKYYENYAAELESSYPYAAQDQACKADQSKGVQKVSGYSDVPKTEEALYKALQAQPISVAFDIQSIYQYKSGIISKAQCNYKQLNHAALLTGFKVDTESKTPYWVVKNSWGVNWGEEGFLRIQAFTGDEGACGIALENSYPSI